jgi:hypothetical protein
MRRRPGDGHRAPPGGVECSANVNWQEKNIAVGLAALFVLIVMAHLTFGPGPSAADPTPVAEPAPAPVAHDLTGSKPLGAPGTDAQGR